MAFDRFDKAQAETNRKVFTTADCFFKIFNVRKS